MMRYLLTKFFLPSLKAQTTNEGVIMKADARAAMLTSNWVRTGLKVHAPRVLHDIKVALVSTENDALERAARKVEALWQNSVGGYPSGSELAAEIRKLKS